MLERWSEARTEVFRWITRYATRMGHPILGQIHPIELEQHSALLALTVYESVSISQEKFDIDAGTLRDVALPLSTRARCVGTYGV